LQVEFDDVLFVDDNGENVRTAKELGMNAEVFVSSQGLDAFVSLLDKYQMPVSIETDTNS